MAEMSEKRALAIELLDIERAILTQTSRIEAVKARLKEISKTSGAFREIVPEKGEVSVRPASAAKFKGIVPVLDMELYLASEKERRDKLEQDGIVTMTPTYGRPGYASVTVDLAKP